ncbi:hypothetical protein IC582_028356 [Cucumis melo]
MTIVENDKGEFVPTRIQNGWHICINYRKLNEVTKKDHFPFPYLDQMIKQITGKSYFCFLDGFLVFTKYLLHVMTKTKPLLHVILERFPLEECHLDCVMLLLHFKDACLVYSLILLVNA